METSGAILVNSVVPDHYYLISNETEGIRSHGASWLNLEVCSLRRNLVEDHWSVDSLDLVKLL
jgi:hypothetical protein